MPRAMAEDDTPLFCPFCRESYEGERQCPEHELTLVRLEELASRQRPLPADDEPVELYDLRFGRGWLLVATMMIGGAPLLPFVTSTVGDTSKTATGYEVAMSVAPNLWIVPCVAAALFSVLWRRRSPASMRGARVVVPALALLAAVSVGYTLWRVQDGAHALAARHAAQASVEPRMAVWVLGAAIALAAVGGARLGVFPRSARRREAPPE